MLLKTKPKLCKTCNRVTGGSLSGFQIFWLLLLAPTFIGWILYFCLATPKLCYLCGLKRSKDCSKYC